MRIGKKNHGKPLHGGELKGGERSRKYGAYNSDNFKNSIVCCIHIEAILSGPQDLSH